MNFQPSSDFLSVKSGDYILIKDENDISYRSNKYEDFWIGQVIHCIGGARDPNAWTLFQVMNIDNGEITIINADIVEKILKTS